MLPTLLLLACATLVVQLVHAADGVSNPSLLLRPAYHILPSTGWANDPNGMFHYLGVYHVFYQHNPRSAEWGGPIAWAHAASTDLAHWTRLPLALQPGPEPYDADGVFSGSVTVVDGHPRLLYTCVSRRAELSYFYQQQCEATPRNASDPMLVEWVKSKSNPLPMDPPSGGSHAQWRDPSPAWWDGPGQRWRMLIGAQVACRGAAALYESRSFANWSFAGLFAAQQDGGASSPGAACSQFGDAPGGGRAWETPGAFQLGSDSGDPSPASTWWLTYGDQASARQPFAQQFYQLGRLSSRAAFVASSPPRLLDGGEVYAAQSFQDGARRRLLLAWAQETPPAAHRGWQGVLTLPRVLGLSPDGQALTQHPAPELQLLRAPAAPVYAAPAALSGAPAALPMATSASRGMQREVELSFRCPLQSCAAGILLLHSALGVSGPRTRVTLQLSSGRGMLVVDRTHTVAGVGTGPYDSCPQQAAFTPLSRPRQIAPCGCACSWTTPSWRPSPATGWRW